MNRPLQVEQLEERDTPSVSFGGPTGLGGVPFASLVNPGQGNAVPNITGSIESGVAIANADVFGAPLVVQGGA